MNIELREHRLAITSFLSATAILVFALTLRMAGAQLSWDGQDYAQLASHFSFFQDCSTLAIQQRVLWSGLYYIGTVVLILFTFEPIHGVALLSTIIFSLCGCGLVYARRTNRAISNVFSSLWVLCCSEQAFRHICSGAASFSAQVRSTGPLYVLWAVSDPRLLIYLPGFPSLNGGWSTRFGQYGRTKDSYRLWLNDRDYGDYVQNQALGK